MRKSGQCIIFITTLLLIISPTVANATFIDAVDQKKTSDGWRFVSKTINLTQNQNDSAYPQITSSLNNIFVVWEESVGGYGSKNYDIYLRKSNDSGVTFGSRINLSNNTGYSEHPQIASEGDNIYVVWVDNTSGKREIMFCKSSDSGKTFTGARTISQNSIGPYHVELAAEGENVYVIWNGYDVKMNNVISLTRSSDTAKTFGEIKEIGKGSKETFPKIAANGDEYYISWDKENIANQKQKTELLFIKGHENGNENGNKTHPVDNLTRLNIDNIHGGESQLAASLDHVLVSWTSNLPDDSKYVYAKVSGKDGNDFGKSIRLATTSNSSNVENVMTNDTAYFVWQGNINGGQDIFLKSSNIIGSNHGYGINLSNNSGISECPSITISKNGLHAVWEDDTPGNHEIFYKRLS
jgi:hypothetical protein